MTGRSVQGVNDSRASTSKARFPDLTKQIGKIMAAKALGLGRENYYTKYDKLMGKTSVDRKEISDKISVTQETRSDDKRKYCIFLIEGAEPSDEDTRNNSQEVVIREDAKSKISKKSIFKSQSNICEIITTTTDCDKYKKDNMWRSKAKCKLWKDPVQKTDPKQL
jgi:hypothetical protein